MAISHGQSLHCSIMGNSLSSLQEVLKTMSIKLNLAEMLPVRSCTNDTTLDTNVYTDMAVKASIEISDNFS